MDSLCTCKLAYIGSLFTLAHWQHLYISLLQPLYTSYCQLLYSSLLAPFVH